MSRLLDRLSISRRLLTISVAFTLPIGVMLFLIVSTINQNITFAQLELNGNAYQRPLEAVLDGLSAHRAAGDDAGRRREVELAQGIGRRGTDRAGRGRGGAQGERS